MTCVTAKNFAKRCKEIIESIFQFQNSMTEYFHQQLPLIQQLKPYLEKLNEPRLWALHIHYSLTWEVADPSVDIDALVAKGYEHSASGSNADTSFRGVFND